MRIQRLAYVLIGLFLPFSASAAELSGKERILYLLDRTAYGPAQGDIEAIQQQGIDAYLEAQLHPERLLLPQPLQQRLSSYSTLTQTLPELARTYFMPQPMRGFKPSQEDKKAAREHMKVIVEELQANKLLRAIYSPAQLQEVMTDFWFNHFNVFAEKDNHERVFISTYERNAIRPYVFGKFRDLLGATAHHPAMLVYLDNWLNTAPGSPGARGRFNGLNENYAREIMELHTLGVDGGYTQEDVTSLARILSGWGIAKIKNDAANVIFYFDEKRHDYSSKLFLGHTIRGRGREEGEQALDILARHPPTAHHISYELAQYFVADQPPESLVNKMAASFTRSDGDIATVLRTMFQAPEFWDKKNYLNKFKPPFRYMVSAIRASNTQVNDVQHVIDRLKGMGEPLYHCLTPDGYPNSSEHWLNSDALFKRIDVARALANGRFTLNPDSTPDDANVKEWMQKFRLAPGPIMNNLGNDFSATSMAAFAAADTPKAKSILVLSSPEILYY